MNQPLPFSPRKIYTIKISYTLPSAVELKKKKRDNERK